MQDQHKFFVIIVCRVVVLIWNWSRYRNRTRSYGCNPRRVRGKRVRNARARARNRSWILEVEIGCRIMSGDCGGRLELVSISDLALISEG